MTTTRIGQETTFEGPGVFDPDGLRRLPAVSEVREERPEELDAVHYDTAGLRLLAHGITLRRRTGGHDEGWHVKLPGERGERREIHAPLRAGKAGHVPGELNRHLMAYTRGENLLPVVHLRTHRQRHLLLDKRGRSLAEVAQDRVAAQVLGAERLHPAGDGRGAGAGEPADGRAEPGGGPSSGPGTSTRLTHWSEIEVGKDQGDDRLMRAAARLLQDGGWYPSPSAHKLDHALAGGLPPDFGEPEPGRRPTAGSAGEAVMNRLGDQLGLLLSGDAAVRVDEADAVHRMRSTSRRLRSLLRGNRRILDRERADPVAGELRWLTGALAGSRDHEVLGARLKEQARGLGDRPLARRIAAQEAERHRAAHQKALVALDSPRYHALLDALENLRAEPPLREDTAGRPAAKHLREVAARDQRRLVRRMDAAGAASAGPALDTALHEARKAARRARHTAETALPYGGKKAARFRRRTRSVQEVLGEHQDAVMARSALRELSAEAHGSGFDTFGYGRLYAHQDELARAARRALPAVRRRAGSPKLVRW